MKITFINGVLTQAPEPNDEEVTYYPNISEDNFDYDQEGSDAEVTIFNSHLQITYLSSRKRRMIGEELLSFTHSLRLVTRIEK